MMSLDGFFGRKNGELDWHEVDEEFQAFAFSQMQEMDLLLFGRRTYELLEKFWNRPEAWAMDQNLSAIMNGYPKIVFSKTLHAARWENTTLIRSGAVQAVKKLKEDPGRDMILLGSGNLLEVFLRFNLIDEYRVMVNPVILGHGIPLFPVDGDLKLQLIRTRIFGNGNVLLCYRNGRNS